jgi:CheY-like chemotaxis protein
MADGEIVLVVDDNQSVRRFVESVLRPLGYKVETAGDGIEALQRITRGPVDLILLDFVMPRMNGYHFVKALDEKGLATDTPVVLLSSTEDRVAEKMKELTRVVDSLPKPVKAGALREVVERNLQALRQAEAHNAGVELDAADGFDLAFDLSSSDDQMSSQGDRVAALRDLLQTVVADGLAGRLGEISAATDPDKMLGIIAETVGATIDDALLDRILELLRPEAD